MASTATSLFWRGGGGDRRARPSSPPLTLQLLGIACLMVKPFFRWNGFHQVSPSSRRVMEGKRMVWERFLWEESFMVGRARHPLAPSRQLATLASLLTPTTQCPSFSAFRCWLKPMQGAQRKLRKEGVVRGGSVSEAKVRTGWSPRVDGARTEP